MELEDSYDSACLELAQHFLVNEPYSVEREHKLSCAIQEAIEEWLSINPIIHIVKSLND